jgi:hypothetical protein
MVHRGIREGEVLQLLDRHELALDEPPDFAATANMHSTT